MLTIEDIDRAVSRLRNEVPTSPIIRGGDGTRERPMDLLLSEQMAGNLGLHAGDLVILRSPYPGVCSPAETWAKIVITGYIATPVVIHDN